MKINKKNPKHWLYLALSGVWIILSLPVRYLLPKPRERRVVLYGHKFNGNLKGFADYCATLNEPDIEYYFLTLDPMYYKQLVKSASGSKPLLLTRLRHVLKVARCDVIITDHGLHTIVLLHKFTDIKFVDVWHGIPYKGFVSEDFLFMKNYTQVWVSSPWLRQEYIKRLKFKPKQVKAPGYARVDRLVKNDYDTTMLRRKYKIGQRFKKIILVAPTWQQDVAGRNIVPFGATEDEFFSALNAAGKKLNSLVIFRAHLNVGNATRFKSMPYVKNMPYALYPDAEEFLALADVFITDWSSMAFDFLPTHKPTVFLDVEPPFKHKMIIGKKYRFGEVVGSLGELTSAINFGTLHPNKYKEKHAKIVKATEELAYGGTQDGCAAERYYKLLLSILK